MRGGRSENGSNGRRADQSGNPRGAVLASFAVEWTIILRERCGSHVDVWLRDYILVGSDRLYFRMS